MTRRRLCFGARNRAGWLLSLATVRPLVAAPEPLTEDAIYGAVDAAGGHLFNALLYLPTGLLTAAILLEGFAQWKRNRDVEPAILFLLFSATGAAVACAVGTPLFTPEGFAPFQVQSAATWMGVTGGIAALAFFLKRLARNQRLFSLRPVPELIGQITPARRNSQKLLLLGYRFVLAAAWLLSLAGLSTMPLTRAPAKPLGQAMRRMVDDVKLMAFGSRTGEAVAEKKTSDADPLAGERIPSEPASASSPTPQLADLIRRSLEETPAPKADSEPEPETVMAEAAPPEPEESKPEPASPAPGAEVAAATSPTEKAQVPAATTPVAAAPKLDRNFFATRVKPILDSKCVSCHGAKSAKGNLRLDGVAQIRQGVKGRPVVVGGDLELSSLYQRLISPDDEDLMPPRDKGGPLPAAMIQVIKTWVQAGADFGDGTSLAANAQPKLQAQPGGKLEEELSKNLPPPPDDLIARLVEAGAVVRPLSSNGALLDLNLSHMENGPDLQALQPIARNIHTLDLTRTRLSDDDLAPLATMVNLVRLDLKRNNTLTDAALLPLKGLTRLEYLNLYGTKVTDAGLAHLAGLKNLRNLYLFETQCTAEGASRLRQALPQLVVNLGELE